jgi:hypothetical protein
MCARHLPRLLVPLVCTLMSLMSARAAFADDDDDGSLLSPLVHTDRSRSHLDPAMTGVWFSLSPELGVVARDPVFATTVGVGFEHALGALHLKAPLTARPLDLPPSDVHPYAPLPCTFVRCAEWTNPRTGQPAWESAVRLVDEARVGHRGDIFHLRIGALRARLGEGALIDGVLTSPMWDARRIGAYLDVGLPSRAFVVEAFVGDVMRAADLAALKATVRPALFLPGEHTAPLPRFFDRAALSLESAVDFGLPSLAYDELYASRDVLTVAPLVGANATASWALLEESFFVGVRPFVTGSFLYGLSSTGGAPWPGGGASTGVDLALTLPYVGLHVSSGMTADTPGHRHGVFGPLYFVERDHALAQKGPGGLRNVPAPGGFGAFATVELAIHEFVRMGARLRLDPTPTGNTAEAFVEGALFGARLSARGITRGFKGSVMGMLPDDSDLFALDQRTLVVTELAVPIYGPLSFTSRVVYAPRVLPNGALRFDPDVLVGISSDIVLDSPVFDWL